MIATWQAKHPKLTSFLFTNILVSHRAEASLGYCRALVKQTEMPDAQNSQESTYSKIKPKSKFTIAQLHTQIHLIRYNLQFKRAAAVGVMARH